MTLTEVIETFKTKLNPSKIINSLEKKEESYIEVDNNSEENGLGKIPQNGVSPIIKLDNVWKIYKMGDNDFAALAGINLEINEGEFLVILGPSGSGKSTLMNLIGCLDLPSKGSIFLESKNIAKLSESELAQIRGEMIGFIFQSFNLIPTLNTEENVMLPMEFQEVDVRNGRKRAEYLLGIVGLSDKTQNLPSQLSGGQMQRVAIARSLAVNPPIILADEPTGNLDSKTGNYILDFLNDLHEKENKTIIIVTHDVEIVKLATRVVHLKDGQIESIESCTKDNPCTLRE
jgi:putative ABC transport system ATP-binding protein